MRKVLLVGAGLAVLAGGGVAMAQMPPGPGLNGPGPGGPGPRPPGMMEQHDRMAMRMMQMASRSAAFRFKRGDTEIGIKCAADEPTQACVAAASALIDKIGQMQQQRPAQ